MVTGRGRGRKNNKIHSGEGLRLPPWNLTNGQRETIKILNFNTNKMKANTKATDLTAAEIESRLATMGALDAIGLSREFGRLAAPVDCDIP